MGFGTLQRSDSFARLKEEGLRRFHMWPKSPRAIIDLSVQDKEEFELSKEYEVKCQLLANSAESESSSVLGGFPAGTCVTVLRLGTTCSGIRRLKVTNKSGSVSGWVSSVHAGKPSLCKVTRSCVLDFSLLRSNSGRVIGKPSAAQTSPTQKSNSGPRSQSLSSRVSSSVNRLRGKADLGLQPTKYPQIGDWLEPEGRIVVRQDESISSLKILSVKGGCQMKILDYGKTSPSRVKVLVDGTIGWVTILDKNLLEPLCGRRPHTY